MYICTDFGWSPKQKGYELENACIPGFEVEKLQEKEIPSLNIGAPSV